MIDHRLRLVGREARAGGGLAHEPLWICDRTPAKLRLSDEAIMVLGTTRPEGTYEGDTAIHPGTRCASRG